MASSTSKPSGTSQLPQPASTAGASPYKAPGFVVGFVAALHAFVFGGSAALLPWDRVSSFGISAGAMAFAYLVLALAVWTRRPQGRSIWRFVSVAAIVFLGTWAYLAASGAVYLARIYGGLGEGLALATAAAFTPVALFTLPFAFWGLAATREARPRRGLKIGAVAGLLLAGFGLGESCASAGTHELPVPAQDTAQLQLRLHEALREQQSGVAKTQSGPSARLFTLEPVACAADFERADDQGLATAYLSYVVGEERAGDDSAAGTSATVCLQDPPETLVAKVAAHLEQHAGAGPAKLDFVHAWAQLEGDHALVDGLKLRPGLDGACVAGRCLMPWQLVASDQFTKFVPVPFIADLRVGFDPAVLGAALGENSSLTSASQITRIATHSFWIDAQRSVRHLVRGRGPVPVVDELRTRAAARAAEGYILSAQENDGRFRYTFDPFTGKIDRKNYNMPRQAGTTLALCELGEYNSAVDRVVSKSLAFMARRARAEAIEPGAKTQRTFLTKAAKAKRAQLGATALPLIAFTVCRDRVGDRYDALIGDMGRALLAMQTSEGPFAPAWDRVAHRRIEGAEPLFAEGQVVFGLSMMERIQREGGAIEGWPDIDTLTTSVERAMDHYAGPYWDHALAQFFWIEENWHCLAARASLTHHRHDGYERMCLDYVRYKHRLALNAESRVAHDFEGGYGFGNLIAPHNTGTAGYGEALAAAISLARARGEDSGWLEQDLRAAHTFLLRQQWGPANDFAVKRSPRVRGAFSESMSSPLIRIDYVQHAMAALGHGARVLYPRETKAP